MPRTSGALGLLLVLTTAGAALADGGLDPDFGNGGVATVNPGTNGDRPEGVAIRRFSDEDVIVAGTSDNTGGAPTFDAKISAAALDPGGVPDPDFGGDGYAEHDFLATEDDEGRDVVVGTDGDVYIAVTTQPFTSSADVGVVRFDADGDSIVDSGLSTRAGPDDAGTLWLQPDNKVVIGGSAGGDAALSLQRFDANLDPDTTFGNDATPGRLIETFGDSEAISDVKVQGSGRILAIGDSRIDTTHDLVLLAYDANGDRDPSFSGDGLKIVDLGSEDEAGSITTTGSGKIVVAAQSPKEAFADKDLVVMRFKENGKPDRKFSGDGEKRIDMGENTFVGDVMVAASGKIVVTGLAQDNTNGNRLAAARLTKRGKLDTTFSGDGRRLVDVSDPDVQGGAGTLDAEDRVVIVGTGMGIDGSDFVAVRLE